MPRLNGPGFLLLRTTKRIYYFGATILVTFAVSWFVFVQIYKPSDSAYLETATSHYFKHMSDAGLGEFASYDDCRLDQGDLNVRTQATWGMSVST